MREQRETLPEWTRQRTPERTREREDTERSDQAPDLAEADIPDGDKERDDGR